MCPDKYIAVFRSARDVIKADAACRKSGLSVRVIAVPETISSECGMCLEIASAEKNHFIRLMSLNNISTQLYDSPSV